MRILGIDPGSRLLGFGCLDVIGNQLQYVAHGTFKISNTSGIANVPVERRLLSIYEELSSVIQKLKPQVIVVEKVFFAKNAVSALKLGQARGAVILTGAIHHLEFFEYSPNEVKQVVVGQGHAEKEQVARMVRILTGCPGFSTYDASDALALAICHAHSTRISSRSMGAHQALQESLRQHKKKRLTMAEAIAGSVGQSGGRKIR